ncbi:hypothetical protein H310_10440 [Aphanomyces invadans]|uniref:DNA replication licensing factor MCM4 n=1 Tax=Aphanomyces invadans TaxID=157072 RepID=A0A024TRK5_9STRA|nr:hypothetical protein H310_10440 [Aphanomyces invadans]ETV96261.1 hypothetical protein H310_10440 [Aphanomyces invadans]|eukprot:XP_008875053.1 hypothetical protein H310_10440 [Aphanomyces invadans]
MVGKSSPPSSPPRETEDEPSTMALPDTPPSSPLVSDVGASTQVLSSPPVTSPSRPVLARAPATPPSSPESAPTASTEAQINNIRLPSSLPSTPLRPALAVPDTPPSSPLSPSGSTQQQAAILRDAPATPPSPSSFSQPSVSISATADLHYTHQDYSASIDATPMPRYLGRYAEGDINVGLNRALPRGDLGRSQVRLDVPLPQQASAALNPDSPPSSPMSDGHRQFPAAPASPGSASLSLRPNDVDLAPPMAEQSYSNAVVWGTNVNVAESMRVFRVFLQNFVPRELDGSDESYYRKVLRQIHLTQEGVFNLDCQHLLQSTDETKVLYTQLLHFPQVLVRILDMVVQDAYKAMFSDDPDATRIQVRPFNLKEVQAMRNLNPSDIDQLVSLQGMVTRCSAVIPDLKMAFFRCTTCHADVEVELDRGRIDEPSSCRHCQSRNSMEIVHNRCAFTDKQLVKMQETPDAIPEGETPYTVMLFCFDDLVDDVRPGDKVQVTGIYRAVPLRATVKQRVVKSVFKTYVDVVHFRKVDELYNQGGGFRDANAVDAITNAKLDEFRRIAADPLVYENLSHSLAPSIWELDDVKKGVLCQLFGGARKGESGPDKKHTRSDLNVLLCGDPGTSKSQLLSYVHKLAPRGIYTSGKGSSAVGLTASVVRDMETGDFVLESGALVLSDEGICCIDEFDKMSDSARSVLHEVMEQQTVSIAKAGIICSLNARASILASANPIESRYNPAKSVIENINILPTLLSRFDLIYLILDRPNADADRQLARHIVSMYYDGYTVSATTRTSEVIKMSVLSEYIAYAKKHIHPKLTEAAAADLVAGYLGLRRMGNNRKNITATPRQLESLIRIAEALAKMKLSATVTSKEVAEALRLMHVATQKAAMDPRTGTIDMDMITTGLSTLDRQTLQTMVADLKQILDAEGSMSLGDAKRKLDEARGTETKPTDFQSAIRLLEEDSVVQITHGTLRYMADHRGA